MSKRNKQANAKERKTSNKHNFFACYLQKFSLVYIKVCNYINKIIIIQHLIEYQTQRTLLRTLFLRLFYYYLRSNSKELKLTLNKHTKKRSYFLGCSAFLCICIRFINSKMRSRFRLENSFN